MRKENNAPHKLKRQNSKKILTVTLKTENWIVEATVWNDLRKMQDIST